MVTLPEVVLTLLYAPGDRPELVAKALAGPADVVIVDLEDAVAPSAKEAARATLSGLTAELCTRVQVRVNALGTPWHEDDLAAAAAMPPTAGVRVPKVTAPHQVVDLAAQLPGVRLHLLLEDALGVERAFELATAHEAVASIGLGEADLRSDLGVESEEGLAWARSRVVNAARAAGLPAPQMSVYATLRDPDGLRPPSWWSSGRSEADAPRRRARVVLPSMALFLGRFQTGDGPRRRGRAGGGPRPDRD